MAGMVICLRIKRQDLELAKQLAGMRGAKYQTMLKVIIHNGLLAAAKKMNVPVDLDPWEE